MHALRPVLIAVLLVLTLTLGAPPAPVAAAPGAPVTALFEPDASDLGSIPLPNHLLSQQGQNRVPGTSKIPGALAAVNAVQGFGTSGPIYIPFSGTLDPRTVTDSSVVVLGPTGRHPVTLAVITYQSGRSSVRIDPLLPFEGSTRYHVFVTDAVRAPDHQPVRPSAFLESMRSAIPLQDARAEQRRRDYAPIWAAARERLRLEPTAFVQAFAFTTQPIGSTLQVLRRRVQATTPTFTLTDSATTPEQVDALYKRLGVTAAHPHVAMVFKGTITTPRYLEDPSKTPMKFSAPHEPIQVGTNQVPFFATIPKNATGPVPVVFYQHGSYLTKLDILRIADGAAMQGLGVIGIDAELHGERSAVINGERQHSGTNLVNLDIPILIRDVFYQTYSDEYSAIRMVRLGRTNFTGGKALMSTDRLAVMGHSMGAIMSSTLAATEPDAAVAVLNAPGSPLRSLLLYSAWFRSRVYAELGRRGIFAVTPECDQYYWMLQTAVDDIDPFNYGPIFRKRADIQCLLQEMAGETVMPNEVTEGLARSFGLTQVHPVRPVSPLPQAPWPHFGSALFQFTAGEHNTIVNPGEGPTASVHEQAFSYIASGLKGRAKLIMPDIPIPDLHINMKAAPGQ